MVGQAPWLSTGLFFRSKAVTAALRQGRPARRSLGNPGFLRGKSELIAVPSRAGALSRLVLVVVDL